MKGSVKLKSSMAYQLRFGLSLSQYWTSPRSHLMGINFQVPILLHQSQVVAQKKINQTLPKGISKTQIFHGPPTQVWYISERPQGSP